MVFGIGYTQPEQRAQQAHRPALPPSTRLRSLAWMRFLLDNAAEVEAWALGNKPPPDSWTARAADAGVLRDVFTSPLAPTISSDAQRRPVSLLDKIFDPVLHRAHASAGRWFSDRVRRGQTNPDAQRLKWFDDLVPGSAKAFDEVPPGMAPGFYDALDFDSPWFGRLHLWRVIDPAKQDAAWERLLDEEHVIEPGDERIMPTGLPYGVWRRRSETWRIRPAERRRLRDEIALALAHVAYPGDVDDHPGFDSPRQIMRAAAAACERAPSGPNPVRDRVRAWSEARQWEALTDALAALRLERIAVIGNGLAGWWVRSVMEGMADTIEKLERKWFCSMTNNAPPLTTFLTNTVSDGARKKGRKGQGSA